jgi:hypothetical protein
MKIVPGDGNLNYNGVRWEEAHTHKTDRLPVNGELKHDCATWFEGHR